MPSDYISLNVGNIVAKRFLDTGEKRLPFLRLLTVVLLLCNQIGSVSFERDGPVPALSINGEISHGALQQRFRLSGRAEIISSPQLDKGFLQGVLACCFAKHARSQSQECFRQKIRHLIYKTQKGCKCNMFPDLPLQKRPNSSDPPGNGVVRTRRTGWRGRPRRTARPCAAHGAARARRAPDSDPPWPRFGRAGLTSTVVWTGLRA